MRKKRIWIGFVIVFILGVGAQRLYSSDAVMFGWVEKADERWWSSYEFLARTRRGVGKFMDQWNPFFSEKNIERHLEMYELTLSPRDVREFLLYDEGQYAGTSRKPGADFRKVELRHKGITYDAKLKIHGDDAPNWGGKRKNFQVKLAKGEAIGGQRRFIFTTPDSRRHLTPFFASSLAKQLRLPYVRHELVVLKMNDVFQGIYNLEERVDEKFLERHGYADGVIIQLTDNWIEDREAADGDVDKYYGGITYNNRHLTPFNLQLANTEATESKYGSQIAAKVQELFEAVEDEDVSKFEQLVDIEKMGAIDAWRTVLGDQHSLVGDNARLVYLLSSGKFFLIPRSEGDSRKLEYQGGSFEAHINMHRGQLAPLLSMLSRSEKVRQMRNLWLHALVTDREKVIQEYDELIEQFEPLLVQDVGLPESSRELRYLLKDKRDVMAHNLSLLAKDLAYHKVYVSAEVNRNQLLVSITPDTSLDQLKLTRFRMALPIGVAWGSAEPVQFQILDESGMNVVGQDTFTFDIERDLIPFFEGIQFGFDFDHAMLPKARKYHFRFVFPKRESLALKGLDLSFQAVASDTPVAENDVYLAIANGNQDYSALHSMSPEQFVSRYSELHWRVLGNQVILTPGQYVLERDLIVPPALALILQAGVDLTLSGRKSVVSYGSVEIKGTKESPVVIRAKNADEAFGTFAVVGQTGRKTKITHLDLSGGSEGFIDGKFFSGALSIYHSDLEMTDSNIHGNFGDDGLNVRSGRIDIRQSRFENNFADQIDVDYCEGVIEDSIFQGARGQENQNGDGLDVSGSKITINASRFEQFSDKGISVGEASKVALVSTEILNSNIGVAVKDQSLAYFQGNRIEGNRLGISAYQKKDLFGGGSVYLAENAFTKNERDIQFDPHSVQFHPTRNGVDVLKRFSDGAKIIDWTTLFGAQLWEAQAHVRG